MRDYKLIEGSETLSKRSKNGNDARAIINTKAQSKESRPKSTKQKKTHLTDATSEETSESKETAPLMSSFEKNVVKLSDSNTDPFVQNFFDTLQGAEGKNLLICLKGYPDPDNIATALALQWLCKGFSIRADIVYFDEISHHENRALVKKLDLELIQYDESFDVSKYEYFAVNDSQSSDLPIELPPGCELLIFVDHHKTLGTVSGHHVDIREDSGSTASIYSQYLMHSPVPFTGENSDENKIATALMHGVRTDTDNFVNAQPIDFKASEFLAKKIDRDLLALISRQSIPAKTMDLTQIALQHKDVKETFLFSGVGYVREEERDGIGQCADYLLNREGIETVVVYGIVGSQWVDGSLRTKSHTLDPDKWLKDIFGHDKDGTWYGGGRKDKGGFQIPLGVFAKCSDRELLWIMVKKTIDELFYEKIGFNTASSRDSDIASGKV